MVHGVDQGFVRKLIIEGVGYRARMEGSKLVLTLGFSHPVEYTAGKGVTIEVPAQTEVSISGADKQQVGQVAADIRAIRPPNAYSGKGVRFAEERLSLKESKKK